MQPCRDAEDDQPTGFVDDFGRDITVNDHDGADDNRRRQRLRLDRHDDFGRTPDDATAGRDLTRPASRRAP